MVHCQENEGCQEIPVEMTKQQKRQVQDTIELEGFDYTFWGYTSFSDIKDPKFHKLREAFLAARKDLAEYVGVDN